MTRAEHTAIILGRFATRPDAYKATSAHPRFGELLRQIERAYPMAMLHTDAGRRREEEIDAVIVAFILATDAEDAGTSGAGGAIVDRRGRGPMPVFHDRGVIEAAARMFTAGENPAEVSRGSGLSSDDAYRLRSLMDGGLIRSSSRGGLHVDPVKVQAATDGSRVALRWRESEHGPWLNPRGRNAQRPPLRRSRKAR